MKNQKKTGLSGIVTVIAFALITVFAFSIAACAKTGPSVIKSKPESLDLRIYINEDKQFEVSGKRIWINGVNTPWDTWNDFGGTGTYRDWWWDAEFSRLREAGINATRVWINCNGYGSIDIAQDGTVNGVTSQRHWNDLDSFFALAKKYEIYIMATLTSFDHYKTVNYRSDRWRAMITSKEASQSFAQNYTIPFVQRYGDNPYLWSIDLCNEPEWISEGEGDNVAADRIPWDNISYFMAVNAAAIHENSRVLVTVGIAYPKWNIDPDETSAGRDYRGNKVSDEYLQSLYPNENAYVDFWSTHYYDWVGRYYGVPHYLTPDGALEGNSATGWSGGWGLDGSKPALIGECSAQGTGLNLYGLVNNTIITDYEQAFENGWQGVMPWTSNGVGANGDLHIMKDATLNMWGKYKELIYPWD